MRLGEVLAEAADRFPHRPALTEVGSGRRSSYSELHAAASAMRSSLESAGVARGHRVAFVADNSFPHIPAAFAVLATGAALVPLASTLRPAETDAAIEEIDVHVVVRLNDGALGITWLNRDRRSGAPMTSEIEPAFIRFSSGTTAERKGVILTAESVLARVASASSALGLCADDRILWTLPLSYHFAATIVAYVQAGAEILLVPEAFPADVVAAAARYGATVLYGSPMQFRRMAAAAHGARLPDLRVAVSTSAPLSTETAARFGSEFGVPLGQAYGIIEAGLPCIRRGTEDSCRSSVGLPAPGYDVDLRDDLGRSVSQGSEGRVFVRGVGLFSGYYHPWVPADRAAPDGWFDTGDIGRFDAEGRLHLCGRAKSVIVVAGMKVFPEEVESVLDRTTGVLESRVFGRPHPQLGEVPVADVVVDSSVATLDRLALAKACAASLSTYKVPVEFRRVSTIPRTPGGKVLRRRQSETGSL